MDIPLWVDSIVQTIQKLPDITIYASARDSPLRFIVPIIWNFHPNFNFHNFHSIRWSAIKFHQGFTHDPVHDMGLTVLILK